MPLLAGDRIESYELLRKCGRGAYGEVWIAIDPLKRQVALKIIDKFSRAKDELKGLMTYFEMPPNPHLISIYHIGETKDFYYYTMELADNASDTPDEYIPRTLETVLAQNGAFSVDNTIELGNKLLVGISALHKAGLVHRDLKPSNIIYINGEPKISDVGLVIKANVPATLIGSIGFITPERIANTSKKVYSATDDLYALGKILYCYWTGNPPEDYPALPAKCFASPKDALLNDVIKHACSNSLEKRFQNDNVFAEYLNTLPSTENNVIASQRNSSQNHVMEAMDKLINNYPLLKTVIFLSLVALTQTGLLLFRRNNFYNLLEYYEHLHDYLVIDLSSRQLSSSYPVHWSATPPDLDSNVCRTDELWLKRIPAGSFMMGSPENEPYRQSNETLHKVDIQHDFYMGIFEVTQMQYYNVRNQHDSHAVGDARPVEWLKYGDIRYSPKGWPEDGHNLTYADSFLNRLQRKTKLRFDLPTEAEWEYACRAGTTGATYCLYDIDVKTVKFPQFNYTEEEKARVVARLAILFNLQKIARYSGNGGFLMKRKDNELPIKEHNIVGSYLPNDWGMYDMLGNVWEYCLDWYEDMPGAQLGLTPTGSGQSPTGELVIRGGGWRSGPDECRAARRRPMDPNKPNDQVGFRIVYPSDLPEITLPDTSPTRAFCWKGLWRCFGKQ